MTSSQHPMKSYSLTVLVFFAMTVGPLGAQDGELSLDGPKNGLTVYLPLDEKSGQVTLDPKASGQQGEVKGKAVWVVGKFGAALDFDGETYVDVGNAGDFEPTDAFSYGAWVDPTNEMPMAVLAKMDDASNYRGYDLLLAHRADTKETGPHRIFVHLVHNWPDNAIRVNTRKPLRQGQWHHVMATYDGSGKAKGVKIYLDGEEQLLDHTDDNLSGSIKTRTSLRIGRRSPGGPFQGKIDEVRIYNRELSSAEVAQLAGVAPTSSELLRVRAEAGDTVVKLTWDAPEHRNVIGYRVYAVGSTQPLHGEFLTATEFTDGALNNGRVYKYEVRAVLDGGEQWKGYGQVSAIPLGTEPSDENFHSWSAQGLPDVGKWEVSTDGRTVVFAENEFRTCFVGPDNLVDVILRGRFKVQASGDDDYVGFVFGYRAPLGEAGEAVAAYDFLLFDWKMSDQVGSGGLAREGFSLVRVQSANGSFWGHKSTDDFEVLASDYGADKGWRDNVEYDFELVHSRTRVQISIDGKTVFDLKGDFPSGRFGFYNYSQANAHYSGFTRQAIPDDFEWELRRR